MNMSIYRIIHIGATQAILFMLFLLLFALLTKFSVIIYASENTLYVLLISLTANIAALTILLLFATCIMDARILSNKENRVYEYRWPTKYDVFFSAFTYGILNITALAAVSAFMIVKWYPSKSIMFISGVVITIAFKSVLRFARKARASLYKKLSNSSDGQLPFITKHIVK